MHTKGPWTIKWDTNIFSGERLVANTGGHRSNVTNVDPENQANARLIAAAPEQNSALIDLVTLVKRIVPDADILHEVQNADEAIRKAKETNDG